MLNPSLSISPWMRGAPQVGFSATMREIKSRSSLVKGFLPPTRRVRESHAQYNRKPARCQRTTVSGLTTISDFFQPDHRLFSATQNNLSRAESRARPLRMQSQQLLPKGEVLQNEVFSGVDGGDEPAEKISKAHKHEES